MNQEDLAKDCKAFYEKRLQLTHSVADKWSLEADQAEQANFSKLPHQIAQLRSELLSLAHLDNELFKNLLALNDKLEELKLQRDASSGNNSNEDEEAVTETTTTEEYDDDDIDEEVEDFYSSLPPTQILEKAAGVMANVDQNSSSSSGSGGLDVMGGLKFMLRSRSFLLRPPFHKKNTVTLSPSRTTPRRSRITSSDSPFRTFDRIQENRVSDSRSAHRSQSAERQRSGKRSLKLEAGSSATLTRGFHLPHSSKSLWQRVFVGGGSSSTSSHASSVSASSHNNNNGPESLPCSWSIIDMEQDKSPPPTLKHIKQNSFDSGIHHSDSSEYSIKV